MRHGGLEGARPRGAVGGAGTRSPRRRCYSAAHASLATRALSAPSPPSKTALVAWPSRKTQVGTDRALGAESSSSFPEASAGKWRAARQLKSA